jgi:hypothetical protein
LNYKPPQDKNVYIGMLTRSRQQGTANASLTTRALWADYDNTSLQAAKDKIRAAALPCPSFYVASGHGIHAYWKLNAPLDDPTPYLKAIIRATGADPACSSKAQVMRLPGTMNTKDTPTPCRIIENNALTYSLDQFNEIPQETTQGRAFFTDENTPPCIQAISRGVKQGHRNFATGRLTRYLKQRGYDKHAALEMLLSWNKQNTPPERPDKLIKDFWGYWKPDYKLLGCALDNPELQSILQDYCDKTICLQAANIDKLKLDNAIAYNNRLFNDYGKLSGNMLIVFGLLLIHKDGLTQATLLEKLTTWNTKRLCMSHKTMRKQLSDLNKIGLIETIRGNARTGKENFYKAIPQGTYGKGYTLATTGAINGAIDKRITPAQFKCYVLLLKYAFGKRSCYPSQITLAKELNIPQPNVVYILNALEKRDYLKRHRKYKGYNSKVYSVIYELIC